MHKFIPMKEFYIFIIMILITRALGIVMTSYSLNGSIIPYNTWWGLLSWAIIGVAVIVLFIFLYKKGDKISINSIRCANAKKARRS